MTASRIVCRYHPDVALMSDLSGVEFCAACRKQARTSLERALWREAHRAHQVLTVIGEAEERAQQQQPQKGRGR